MTERSIGFLGAGQMARALAQGFINAGLIRAESISAADPSALARDAFAQIVPAAHLCETNFDVVERSDIVFLAVKPLYVTPAAAEARTALNESKLVVSIVAGVTLAALEKNLGVSRLIRVMPNTPCLVGASAAAYSLGRGATPADAEIVAELLQSVGVAIPVEERLLDAVTGLSGSGPAYGYLMIEAMADGGVRMGLPREVALTLAAQTLLGAAKMVLQTHEHPAMLKDRVASPGGTTIVGLQVLEDRGVRGAVIAAVEAAARHADDLGK